MNILVIAAHPDDEVLGCGGTIARLSKEGHKVWISILGQGVTSRFPDPKLADSSMLEALRDCSRSVGRLLGAREVLFNELPDNRFDTVALLDIVKIIESLLERIQPDVVYTHDTADLNIDHVVLLRAVLTATRPVRDQSVKEINTFEIPSSTEWSFGRLQSKFCPNVFVDIKETLSTKIEALKQYRSEVRDFPHPRSPEALKALAQYRGSTVGLEAAEAFALVRKTL